MLAQICDTLLSSSVLEDEGSASHDLISDTAAAKTSDLAAEPSACIVCPRPTCGRLLCSEPALPRYDTIV
jgi:hypothetical protein